MTSLLDRNPMAAPASKETERCKGVHIKMAQAAIDEWLGAGAFDGLAADLKLKWPMPVLASTLYDVESLVKLLEVVAHRTRRSVESLSTDIARRNAEHDLKTIYKTFMRIAQPVRVLSLVPTMWRTYFTFGEVVVLENDPGTLRFETRNVPARFVPYISGGWRGFLSGAIEAAGGSQPSVRVLGDRPESLGRVTVELLATYRK